jgi:hypothetical protein
MLINFLEKYLTKPYSKKYVHFFYASAFFDTNVPICLMGRMGVSMALSCPVRQIKMITITFNNDSSEILVALCTESLQKGNSVRLTSLNLLV